MTKMKSNNVLKYILGLSFILLISLSVEAKESVKTFDDANKAYQQNDYDKAIKGYEAMIQDGDENAEIYYNLGNAYYKKDEIAKAILNYEKAKKLSHSDEDIAFNLRMANLKVTDKVISVPELFYKTWWNELLSHFNWPLITVILIWLLLGIFMIFLLSKIPAVKRTAFYVSLLIILFAVGSFMLANIQSDELNNSTEAIVFSQSVYVKSSPTDKSTDLFILHEGTKVQVLDEVGAWKKIKLANGNVGWLQREAIEMI